MMLLNLTMVLICFQSERRLRSGRGAGFADRSSRSRRHILRMLQDHAGVEICEYPCPFLKSVASSKV